MNDFISKDNIHFNANSRFTELSLKGASNIEPQLFWEKELIESAEGNQLKFTEKGKMLFNCKDWYKFLDWEKTIPRQIQEKNESEYLRKIELMLKQQTIKLNDIELKYKPVNYRIAKAAFIVAVISLLTSVGLWQWLLKCIQAILGHS